MADYLDPDDESHQPARRADLDTLAACALNVSDDKAAASPSPKRQKAEQAELARQRPTRHRDSLPVTGSLFDELALSTQSRHPLTRSRRPEAAGRTRTQAHGVGPAPEGTQREAPL